MGLKIKEKSCKDGNLQTYRTGCVYVEVNEKLLASTDSHRIQMTVHDDSDNESVVIEELM